MTIPNPGRTTLNKQYHANENRHVNKAYVSVSLPGEPRLHVIDCLGMYEIRELVSIYLILKTKLTITLAGSIRI